jgi:hypothetical protein
MKTNKNIVVSIFFSLIGIAGLVITSRLPPPAGSVLFGMSFLPNIYFSLMVIIAVIVGVPDIYATLKIKRGTSVTPQPMSAVQSEKKARFGINPVFWMTLVILLAYILFLREIGFVILSFVCMFAMSMLLAPSRTPKSILIAAVVSIITPFLLNYIFFTFFNVMLPTGSLFF